MSRGEEFVEVGVILMSSEETKRARGARQGWWVRL